MQIYITYDKNHLPSAQTELKCKFFSTGHVTLKNFELFYDQKGKENLLLTSPPKVFSLTAFQNVDPNLVDFHGII